MLRRRHADYYVAFAEEGEKRIVGPSIVEWLDLLEAEHDNLQSVLERSIELGEGDWGLRLVGALWHFWHAHGHSNNGLRWSNEVLNSAGAPRDDLAWVRASLAAGFLRWSVGMQHLAKPHIQEAFEIAKRIEEPVYLAFTESVLGSVLATGSGFTPEEDELCRVYLREGLERNRQLGDRWSAAFSIMTTGLAANAHGDFEQGRSLCEEALNIFRRLGDQWGISQSVNILGDLARIRGEYAEAQRMYEENLALYRKLGNKADIPASLHNLAYVALHQGDSDRARALFKESIALQHERGNQFGVIECLYGLASAALAGKQVERATRLFAAADSLQKEFKSCNVARRASRACPNTGTSTINDGQYRVASGLWGGTSYERGAGYGLRP